MARQLGEFPEYESGKTPGREHNPIHMLWGFTVHLIIQD
jgi:hypothetical protein